MIFGDIDLNSRFKKQLGFIVEIDKIKQIMRKSKLFDNSRFENDAEHSWTICVMAVLLREYADFEFDIQKVLIMLMIHDIVEIDAGDAFLYSAERQNAHNEEDKAAQRIFGLLDDDQKKFFLDIWNEFEEGKTNEAKFAGIFDRLEPLLQNYLLEGYTWKKYDISYDMVIEKNQHIKNASEKIWEFIMILLDDAVKKGYLKRLK